MRVTEHQLLVLLTTAREALAGTLAKTLEDPQIHDGLRRLVDEIEIQQNEIVDTTNYNTPTRDQLLRLALGMYEAFEVTAEPSPKTFYQSPLGRWATQVLYPNSSRAPNKPEEVKKDRAGSAVAEPDFHQKTASLVWGGLQTAAGAVRNVWKERASKAADEKTYYCERCLQIHGHLTKMIYVKHDPGDDADLEGFVCPRCQGRWKLNTGCARHHVSLQLQLYRALAKKLGILEIEEEAEPV